MHPIVMKICLERIAEASACAMPAGSPQHCSGVAAAEFAAFKTYAAHGSSDPCCMPTDRDAKGAHKTIVTDYMFVGSGYATHKLVGWGQLRTPPAPAGAAA